jgi:hypothetical protein
VVLIAIASDAKVAGSTPVLTNNCCFLLRFAELVELVNGRHLLLTISKVLNLNYT